MTPARPGPPLDLDRLRHRNRDRSTVVCQQGIVCSSQPLATQAGLEILRQGGHCVDAAIATNAMLGLTEPAMCGIGGDLFAILWLEEERRLVGLNASGRAPAGWSLERAHDLGLARIPRASVLSWSVPGCVDGWQQLSDRYGRLPLGACFESAIWYAEEGFPLSPIVSTHFAWPEGFGEHMADVYHPGGVAPAFGDVFRNPRLAATYRQIADGGAEAFYRGEAAERMVACSDAQGGFLSLRDLAQHRSDWTDPVSASYRGWDVWELPPNGQGIAALQMLNILECFDIASLEPNGAEHLHLLAEAKKLVYADRAAYYADPEFADVDVERLVSKEYARERAALIDRARAAEQVLPGLDARPVAEAELSSDTVYLTAADAQGNMISFIQSIYRGFGSTICPQGLGFPIQNRGQGFSLDPQHANRLEPGKRPFHTIIPGFVTHGGRPALSFGVMGGDFQPQGHAQVLMHMLDFRMSPQQAGDMPRLEHRGSRDPWGPPVTGPGELVLERGFDARVRAELEARGHTVSDAVDAHGGYQAIWREDDPRVYFGGTDARKDGAAAGY